MSTSGSTFGPAVPDAASVVVIGAGPAGLAATAALIEVGTDVVLIDAAPRWGGQFWRHRAGDDDSSTPTPPWHHGWEEYRGLHRTCVDGQRSGLLRHLSSTQAWALDVEPTGGFVVHLAPSVEGRGDQQSTTVTAGAVVLCPGAYDRQLPVPGWTLPGVLSAGGVQAFIKSQHHAPGRRVLLAGTGPFLLAAATTVLQAGAQVVAVCESTDLSGWVPRGAAAALVPGKGAEGAGYVSLLARHRVPYLRRHGVTEIRGDQRVRAAVVSRLDAAGRPLPGSARLLEDIDLVGLGWGFVPQAELLLQAGGETRIDADGSLVGVVDADQQSTVPGLFLAGEITGVTGASGAVAEGRIAGRSAVSAAPARRRDRITRARHRIFAAAMHRAHPAPDGWEGWMRDDAVVCRCEEVTYGKITEARDRLALADPRSLKGSTRAGMGMCQGRLCGFAMSCLSARSTNGTADPLTAAEQVSTRPIGMPLNLGAFAAHPQPGEPQDTPAAHGGDDFPSRP